MAVKTKAVSKSASASGFYIKSNHKFKKTILSCGGQFKNTFAVAKGNSLYVSPAFGDLDCVENYEAFSSSIERFFKENALKPQVVAFDLHPEYLSAKYAQSLDVSERVGIQHHHAHLASALVEAGNDDSVIGVTFDGTGYGLDGAIWGGEFLVGDFNAFERKARLKYIPMPGGERAIKEPWRMAAGWLYQIYGEDFLNLKIKFVERIDKPSWMILKRMIDKRINSPLTSSMGRLFDAVSSLIGIREKAEYEAQPAIELEGIADRGVCDFYEFKIEAEDGLYVIDPSSVFISIIEELKKNVATSIISARFHNSISHMISKVCMKLRDSLAIDRVTLSGGVFLNRYLLDRVRPQLVANGFVLLEDNRIPVSDSGISVGQALIASHRC